MKPVRSFDLLILGGGPAGMTAAIYAARARLSVVVVESNVCGGAVNYTSSVENFPSYVSIHGMELMQRTRAQMEALGVVADEAAEIGSFDLTGPVKEVTTEECIYHAPALILATGRRPVPLDIDTGTCEQIHFCAVCDGIAYKGKSVLVVGGGNSGFDEAYYLHSIGVKKTYLIEKMDRFSAAQASQEKLLSCKDVAAVTCAQLKELIVEEKLVAARIECLDTGQMSTIPVDGVFVYLGQIPNNQLFPASLSLDEEGYVKTDEDLETNLAGVFAAGDIRQKRYRQITTAVSDGTIAALTAERFLRSRDR